MVYVDDCDDDEDDDDGDDDDDDDDDDKHGLWAYSTENRQNRVTADIKQRNHYNSHETHVPVCLTASAVLQVHCVSEKHFTLFHFCDYSVTR